MRHAASDAFLTFAYLPGLVLATVGVTGYIRSAAPAAAYLCERGLLITLACHTAVGILCALTLPSRSAMAAAYGLMLFTSLVVWYGEAPLKTARVALAERRSDRPIDRMTLALTASSAVLCKSKRRDHSTPATRCARIFAEARAIELSLSRGQGPSTRRGWEMATSASPASSACCS